MKIYFASDHDGFELKGKLMDYVREQGHETEDCGPEAYDKGDDYPDLIRPCAERVVQDLGSAGVIIGASGQGEAMAANRVPGARAAVFYGAPPTLQTDATGHRLSLIESVRQHNHANILSLGAHFLSEAEARSALEQFLATPYSDEERHVRRVSKLG